MTLMNNFDMLSLLFSFGDSMTVLHVGTTCKYLSRHPTVIKIRNEYASGKRGPNAYKMDITYLTDFDRYNISTRYVTIPGTFPPILWAMTKDNIKSLIEVLIDRDRIDIISYLRSVGVIITNTAIHRALLNNNEKIVCELLNFGMKIESIQWDEILIENFSNMSSVLEQLS